MIGVKSVFCVIASEARDGFNGRDATTKCVYDGLNLIRESTAGNNTEYVFGPSIDEPLAVYSSGAVSYLNADGLGSITATNGPTGTVTQGSVFDAWGVARSETGTRAHSFTYAGRELSDAGLSFHRARQYSPGAGRFVSQDPAGYSRAGRHYGYARNNPLAYSDTNGLWPSKPAPFGLGGEVHQASIQRVLSQVFSPADLAYLQLTQRAIDYAQKDQHFHAMANAGETCDEARGRINEKLGELLAQFRELRAAELAGNDVHMGSLHIFGLILHILQDVTSPAHGGPAHWTSDPAGQLAHVNAENFDPGAGSWLDRATAMAYEFAYIGVPIPEDVFSVLGTDRKPGR